MEIKMYGEAAYFAVTRQLDRLCQTRWDAKGDFAPELTWQSSRNSGNIALGKINI